MAEIDAYNEAIQSGQYQKPGGLLGKYDNVRRYWEDEQLGLYLRPYLEQLVAQKKQRDEKLRILDLGCGSGDGLEFITSISIEPAISENNTAVVPPDIIELYTGIDINENLLKQAQASYGNRQNIVFTLGDINNYRFLDEEPYDLYLANYGTLSHNTDEQTIALLSNISSHSKNGALIIIDWLGRYSYEWQTLWTKDLKHNQWMDYAISYLGQGYDTKQEKLTSFPLRFMGRGEVLNLYRRVRRKSGKTITLRKLADRSSFVGRHMDTAQHNPYCQPLRRMVNSLFEPNRCTNLDEVLVRYVPRDDFAEINAYYQKFADSWNYLVTYTKALLKKSRLPKTPAVIPLPLRRAMSTMRNIVRVATRMRIGTPRASIIEPQLGYCLRELEIGLQKGLGCGHGLVAIFEVVK